MDSTRQVIFVLQLVLALGPLAVYFLALGLVNSQARPCLVRARSDFVLLAVAFMPLVVTPMVTLLGHGRWWLALAALASVGLLFFALLPGRDGNWVMYNVDGARCRQLLVRACQRIGWRADASGETLRVTDAELGIRLRVLPWLRSVTIELVPVRGRWTEAQRRAGGRLMSALERESARELLLPSPVGASLVVIGAGLLGLPMWCVLRHLDAIVEVVRQMLPA